MYFSVMAAFRPRGCDELEQGAVPLELLVERAPNTKIF